MLYFLFFVSAINGLFEKYPITGYVFLGAVVLGLAFVFVKRMQELGLERIREIVYQAFLKAEHTFQHGDNKAKFDYVIEVAKNALPSPFNMFITEKLLREVVQLWFDLVKDLLDDGKINLSKRKE